MLLMIWTKTTHDHDKTEDSRNYKGDETSMMKDSRNCKGDDEHDKREEDRTNTTHWDYKRNIHLCQQTLQTVLSNADQFVADLLYMVLIVLSMTNKVDDVKN